MFVFGAADLSDLGFLDQSVKDVVKCLGLPHESLEHDCFSIDFSIDFSSN